MEQEGGAIGEPREKAQVASAEYWKLHGVVGKHCMSFIGFQGLFSSEELWEISLTFT